jgi:hypothetical protein
VAGLIGAAGLLACASGGSKTEKAAGKETWQLVYTHDGAEVSLPLEQMHIYLVEEEDQYPEVFEITGDGVTLVGSFPMDCHVGYDDNFAVLPGKTITIDAAGGARDDKMSYVRLADGTRAFVTGGSLMAEKIEGKIDGMDGDRTLSGTFILRVRTGLGEEELSGRFAVHCYTLG